MLINNSFYKSNNLSNINNRNYKKQYFNPYGYNIESNAKDKDEFYSFVKRSCVFNKKKCKKN